MSNKFRSLSNFCSSNSYLVRNYLFITTFSSAISICILLISYSFNDSSITFVLVLSCNTSFNNSFWFLFKKSFFYNNSFLSSVTSSCILLSINSASTFDKATAATGDWCAYCRDSWILGEISTSRFWAKLVKSFLICS